jgi:hypothetical protein
MIQYLVISAKLFENMNGSPPVEGIAQRHSATAAIL